MKVADRVYVELRRKIVEGRYRPHQRLVEADLTEELSASRTPIRQGLQRLELEGLVVALRSGWAVREHTVEDVARIYDVRLPLEGYAARLAAERGTAEQLKHIETVHAACSRKLSFDERSEYVKLHDEFHDAIFVAANNDVLRDAVLGYRQHPYNLRIAFSYSDSEIRSMERSHSQLVKAIRARDADRAEALARTHLALSLDASAQRLARMP